MNMDAIWVRLGKTYTRLAKSIKIHFFDEDQLTGIRGSDGPFQSMISAFSDASGFSILMSLMLPARLMSGTLG